MNRHDAENEVKRRYAEYLRPARKSGTYICPVCGNGNHEDGTGISVDPNAKNPYTLHCFRCGMHGSVVDFYMKEHNCTVGEAFRSLREYFGITIDREEATTSHTEPRKANTRGNMPIKSENATQSHTDSHREPPRDYTGYYAECREHIDDAAAYLSFRGLSKETASKYGLGYDPRTGFLIIPVSDTFYIARNTDQNAKMRYKNPTGASIELFNKEALYNEAGKPVFVTEGVFDALAILEAGSEAVALNSTSNYRKLIKDLAAKRTGNTLVIALDNDEAGKKAARELTDALKQQNISYITGEGLSGFYKDANEHLQHNRESFLEAVSTIERATTKPDNTADYIANIMAAEIANLKKQTERKTGFPNLDAEAGSIYNGLYVIGGISSVGKTTFLAQLGDQMAEQGQHVLFFSLEQSRLEMVTKSIARQTARNDPDKAVSSLKIRTGATGDNIDRAVYEYSQNVGDRISIIEGNFACTVSFISDYVRKYIAMNGARPAVCVDYLQVLQADKDPETGRKPTDSKLTTDRNITELKRLSRSLEIPVFVVSSLNRSNYLAPIDFEAFKESGSIEFTADVIWGLQLAAVHDSIFDKEGKLKEKREKIAEAKSAIPRKIELVCLKNRYGKTRYTCQYEYYPQYDFFIPDDPGEFRPHFGKTPFENAKRI